MTGQSTPATKTTRNSILLSVQDGAWMARHFGPQAAEVERLFGTTTLPTAFLASTPERDVVNRIAALNPATDVAGPTIYVAR